MTSPQPAPAGRPPGAGDAALYDAVCVEYAVIYGYGLVSAHCTPDRNDLVSTSMAEHRARREAAIAILGARSIAPPIPAAGYLTPMPVGDDASACALAVRMEDDTATAWRAVVERATNSGDRTFGVTAMSQAAVGAARWNQVLGATPITVAFPGGNE